MILLWVWWLAASNKEKTTRTSEILLTGDLRVMSCRQTVIDWLACQLVCTFSLCHSNFRPIASRNRVTGEWHPLISLVQSTSSYQRRRAAPCLKSNLADAPRRWLPQSLIWTNWRRRRRRRREREKKMMEDRKHLFDLFDFFFSFHFWLLLF